MQIRILKSSDTDNVFNILRDLVGYISDFSDEKIGYGVEINGNLVGIGITNMMGDKCHI